MINTEAGNKTANIPSPKRTCFMDDRYLDASSEYCDNKKARTGGF